MSGKSYRMGRMFDRVTGRTVILPVDHGIVLGNVQGLERPLDVLQQLLEVKPNGVLLNHGLGKASAHLFGYAGAPARILNVDTFTDAENTLAHAQINWAEEAVRNGYDAIKAMLFWDVPGGERIHNIHMLARLVREAERWEIPLMIEPTTVRPVGKDRAQVLSDCVRVAFELGADILKVPYPGSADIMREWTSAYPVPFVILGGAASGTADDWLNVVRDALRAGAKGIAIGRNVWQRPLPEAKVVFQKLREVVDSSP